MTTPRRPSAILFDLDGTLVDTAPDFFGVVNSMREELGKPVLANDVIRKQVSNGGAALTELTWEVERDHPQFMDYRNRLLDRYGDHLATGSAYFEGFEQVLDDLGSLGIQWAIVTNKPRRFAEPLLQKLNIETASLICADDLAQAKPHPEGLFKCAAELNVDAGDCWYVGDHIRDIEAGKAAGMYSIAALFGYIEDDDDPAQWGADASIDNPYQLLDLLAAKHP